MEKPVSPVFVDGEKVSGAIDNAIVFFELARDALEDLESGREASLKACTIFFRDKKSELLGTTLSFAYMKKSMDNIEKGIDSIECIDIDVLVHLIMIDMVQINMIRLLMDSKSKASFPYGALNPASINLIMEKFTSGGE